jgi:hypothetical protein
MVTRGQRFKGHNRHQILLQSPRPSGISKGILACLAAMPPPTLPTESHSTLLQLELCGLCYDTLNVSDYVTSNGRRTDK